MKRPLSPHLHIYKWQLTSCLSILHRFSGIGLFFLNIFFLMLFLKGLQEGPHFFAKCQSSVELKAILGVWMYALYYHLFNGLRHLMWDMGKGLGLPEVYKTGYSVLGLTFLAGTFSWLQALGFF